MNVREPAVAGLFYPASSAALVASLNSMLAQAVPDGPRPRALIAPHAGYVYSGPVAASAYALLPRYRDGIDRVVLLGPSHYVPFRGLAAPSADRFETPLGAIVIDRPAIERLLELPQVVPLDAAHAREHSLEVHLPFLQVVLDSFRLVPLAVGEASPDEVAEVLEPFWDDERCLVVVSSDLSHYHDYQTARRLDQSTCRTIEALAEEGLEPDSACGCRAVNGLLAAARRRNFEVTTLDLRNSGDTAAGHDQVVGYGAWVFA
jgi:AmmeMemoRadiSam system protein B